MKLAYLLCAVSFIVLAAGGCTAGFKATAQSVTSDEPLTTTHLEVNAAREPLGLDDPMPRLSWRIESAEPGVKQHSFRVLVATSEQKLEEDSREVVSSDPIQESGRGEYVARCTKGACKLFAGRLRRRV